ncbi:MAG: NAD(P)/FAD-dependent oxidoreductase [Myxococcota bacterium]
MKGRSPDEPLAFAVIGAGFAGVGMAIGLLDEGESNFLVFERSDRLGGTWRDNTYPGCGCDVPSHLYSYSFEPNANWSRVYSSASEILAYLEYCAAKYSVLPHIRFRCGVHSAHFDGEVWALETDQGTHYARYLVGATGPLAVPSMPAIKGRDSFAGPAFHSARWDHSVQLAGKRVGVIGTGASAIQLIPEVAKVAKEVHVFQRTPAWVMPRPDRAYTAREKRAFERFPTLHRAYRNAIYWAMESQALALVSQRSLLRFVKTISRYNIAKAIDDPALQRRVTPDYEPGCKRILISNDYYPALAKRHVHVRGAPDAIEPEGVREDGTFTPLDALVYSTGFKATEFLHGLEVVNAEGTSLNGHWAQNIEAYFGLCVAGFSNLFMLIGPNTTLGHNSMIFMIEAQVHWIRQAYRFAKRRGLRRLGVKDAAERAFNRSLRKRLGASVWSSGCQSWYLDERQQNFSIWPSYTVEYWLRTRRFQPEDFHLA